MFGPVVSLLLCQISPKLSWTNADPSIMSNSKVGAKEDGNTKPKGSSMLSHIVWQGLIEGFEKPDHLWAGVRVSQHPADCPWDVRAVVRMVSCFDFGLRNLGATFYGWATIQYVGIHIGIHFLEAFILGLGGLDPNASPVPES